MYSITKMCYSKNDISAVYLFLSDLCGEYSNFRQWYYKSQPRKPTTLVVG